MHRENIQTIYLIFWDLWSLPEEECKQELEARRIGKFAYLFLRMLIMPFIGFGRLLALFNSSESYFDAENMSFRGSLLSGILGAIPVALFVLFIFRDSAEKYVIALITWPLVGLLSSWYALHVLRNERNAI